MKAVVAAFNQEKALVGAFSVITNLRMELFQALNPSHFPAPTPGQFQTVCWYQAISVLARGLWKVYSPAMALDPIDTAEERRGV